MSVLRPDHCSPHLGNLWLSGKDLAARYSLRVHKSQDIRKQAGSTTALQLEAVTSSEHHDAGGEEDLEMEVAGRLGSAGQKNAWFIPCSRVQTV
ncbi:hypothetical protein E4U32_007852 [Claviceps aff. humidiphila group G2b]|nr:hypothetical protein E4U32_007852 [Claviceps aff. humidiphila group G2b]